MGEEIDYSLPYPLATYSGVKLRMIMYGKEDVLGMDRDMRPI